MELLKRLEAATGKGSPLPGSEVKVRFWLEGNFPHVCGSGFAPRHIRLWKWLEALRPGVSPKAFVAAWPRGGGKSTTVELACARLCVTLKRRFVLYVSESQAQANKHVGSIATLLENLGVERSVNPYGVARGWRMDMLRTANGFNVLALGLDASSRGIKLDEFRPDMIVLDDIDGLHDSAEITAKKAETITNTVLPTGSTDVAVLFVQNVIAEDSLMAQLIDGRADWLQDKEPVSVEPAIVDPQFTSAPEPDGTKRWVVTGGTPTWEGQSIVACQKLIGLIGLQAFLRESQHEVRGAHGIFFDIEKIHWIAPHEVPEGLRWCRSWDLAATEGGGDYTAGPLQGMTGRYPQVRYYLVDLELGQWGSEKVRANLKKTAQADGRGIMVRLPLDPAQAGKFQAAQLQADLAEYMVRMRPPSGSKATRARGLAAAMNVGNVYVVQNPVWNSILKDQLRRFREDVTDQADDIIDAMADGFNELAFHPEPTPDEVKKRDLIRDQSWLPHELRSAPREVFTGDGFDLPEHWQEDREMAVFYE